MKLAGLAVAISTVALAGAAHAAGGSYNWTGAYVGLQGGYSWYHGVSSYDNPALSSYLIAPFDTNGLSGGFEGGWNYQFDGNLVLGVEGDVSFAHLEATVPDTLGGGDNTISSNTDFGANVRARFGMAFGRTLVFGAGGLAIAHTTVSATDGDISDSATLYGWTIGGGVEQAMTNNVSVKLEYLYSAFRNHTWFAGEDYSSTSTGDGSTVRAGINLRF